MNKYGTENFTFKIIEECDYEILDVRERYWINKLNTLEPYGYNIKNGGNKLFGKDNPFYGNIIEKKQNILFQKRIVEEKPLNRREN